MKNNERNNTMKFIKKSSGALIVGLSIMFCFFACQAGQPQPQKQSAAKEPIATAAPAASAKTDTEKTPVVNSKIIVYYFHNNARCPTCFKLEGYAKSVVESDFADAIKKGQLEWKTVNVDDRGNEHFNNDYKLFTKSVIVSTVKDGKEASWKNLDKIWELVRKEDKYREYIRSEVKACLEGKCL
jgi:hypothetical protein